MHDDNKYKDRRVLADKFSLLSRRDDCVFFIEGIDGLVGPLVDFLS